MSVQSTIDKIADTTVMRMIRKMAGVIDEQNETVANVQEQLDNFNIDKVSARLDTDEAQIATNKQNIESNRDSLMVVSQEITAIQETDKEQDKSITALGNADIASVGSEFDDTSRDLKITLNPVSGTAMETTVNIPGSTASDVTGTVPVIVSDNNISLNINSSTLKVDDNGQLTVIGGGGGGGGDYSATLPITIADNAIGIAYDDTLALKDNKLSVVNTGTDYVAGTGITIDNATIAVDDTVVATKASVDAMGITVSEHTSDIASLEQKYDSQSTAISELSTGVSNAISAANTANDTATDANTNVKDCYNSVSISDNVMTFGTVDGESKDITIPASGGVKVTTYANTSAAGGFWQRCLGLSVGDEFYLKCVCKSTVAKTIGGTIHGTVMSNDGVSITAIANGSVYYSTTKGSYLGPFPISNASGSNNSNMSIDQTGLYIDILTGGTSVLSFNCTEWSGGMVITIEH